MAIDPHTGILFDSLPSLSLCCVLCAVLYTISAPDKGDKIGNVPECKTKEVELLSKGDKGGPAVSGCLVSDGCVCVCV